MDSLTYFHSRIVYFYIHYNKSLKVTALDMFPNKIGFTPPLILLFIIIITSIYKFCYSIICIKIDSALYNSPVLQFGAPPAIDSGEAKMRTASWENVDKQMPRNTKL